MARLNFDISGGAFFELIFTDREEGYGAIVHLRVPKGPGRSSFVFHEEFVWGESPGGCREFVAKLSPDVGGQVLAILQNDNAYFSFLRGPAGALLFEARCFAACGEVAFRTEVAAAEVACFYRKLEQSCAAMTRANTRNENGDKGRK